MTSDKKQIIVACVVSSVLLIATAFMLVTDRPKRLNCVEQPSVSLPLKNATVHGRTNYLAICGIRSRSALPDVIQCYEMRDGCTE